MPSEFTRMHQNQCNNPKFPGRHAHRALSKRFTSSALAFLIIFVSYTFVVPNLTIQVAPPFPKASDAHAEHLFKPASILYPMPVVV